MIKVSNMSRLEFNQAVKQFITSKDQTLEAILSSRDSIKEFLNDPVIGAYLSREESQVPVLVDAVDGADIENTDHYELQIYQMVPDLFPYRTASVSSAASILGGRHLGLDSFFILSHLLDIRQRNKLDDIQVNTPFPNAKNRFLLVNLSFNDHATANLHIIDRDTKKTLVTVHLNTSKCKRDYEAIKRKSPSEIFIDASHDLQTNDNLDHQCATYSTNFISAIIEMLTNSNDTSDNIYKLAQQAVNNPSNAGESIQKLQKIFQVHLKQYLKGYYDSTGSKKSIDEIRRYNSHCQWKAGNLVLGPIRKDYQVIYNGYIDEAIQRRFKIDRDMYLFREEFNGHVEKLKSFKQGFNPVKINDTLDALSSTLEKAGTAFFKSRTEAARIKFETTCTNAITTAANALKSEKTFLGKIKSTLLKILGVIGIVTIFPYLIIDLCLQCVPGLSQEQRSYSNLFFKHNPKNKHQKQVEQIGKDLLGDPDLETEKKSALLPLISHCMRGATRANGPRDSFIMALSPEFSAAIIAKDLEEDTQRVHAIRNLT